MKQLILAAVVSAIVACGVSLALREPAAERTRIEKIEYRLTQIARFVGFFLGDEQP